MRRVLVLALVLFGTLFVGVSSALAEAPSNDNFADAQAIEGALPAEVAGTTVEATKEPGEPTPTYSSGAGHSVWFRWVAPVTEYISVSTCDPSMEMAVYTGEEIGTLTEVETEGPNFPNGVYPRCDGESYVSRIRFRAHAGTTYKIWVDGVSFPGYPQITGEKAFRLTIARWTPPANDDFADAESLNVGTRYNPVSTFNATHERGEPYPRGESGGASVWFKWTAPRSGVAELSTCGGMIERPETAVYTGNSVTALTPVAETQPAHNPCYYEFPVIGGETYRIQVDGPYDSSAGQATPFETDIELFYQYLTNDDFYRATSLNARGEPGDGSNPVGFFGDADNYVASKQPGEPNHAGNAGGASVWYTYTVRRSGHLEVSTCNSSFRTLLAVYTGTTLESLNPVASSAAGGGHPCFEGDRTPDTAFNVEAGEVLDIAVDGYDGARGGFDLEINSGTDVLPDPPAPPPLAVVVPPTPPTPKISARHIDQRHRSATFALHSTQPGTHFRCRLDKARFAACGSKVTYRHLRTGHHVFKALSVGPTGKHGAPVTARFSIHR